MHPKDRHFFNFHIHKQCHNKTIPTQSTTDSLVPTTPLSKQSQQQQQQQQHSSKEAFCVSPKATMGAASTAVSSTSSSSPPTKSSSSCSKKKLGTTAAITVVSRTSASSSARQHSGTAGSAVIRRTLSSVVHDYSHVVQQSPFLQQTPQLAHALLHRSEIETGRKLGQGGFSFVYEITALHLNALYEQHLSMDQKTQRYELARQINHPAAAAAAGHVQHRFALKHLQEKLLHSKKGPREFHYAATDLAVEAAFLSRLDHPNIVACRGLPLGGLHAFSGKWGSTSTPTTAPSGAGKIDSFFIVMDLAHDTLDHRIELWAAQAKQTTTTTQPVHSTGPSSFSHRLQSALEIASALEYLHHHRIVFRDLKPSNVGFLYDPTLRQQERALLMDFGLCRELPQPSSKSNKYKHTNDTDDTSCSELFEMSGVGTRRYMAVEIVNSSCYNCKADVYSWAMLFWEMLSHVKPFAPYSMDDHKLFVCVQGVRPKLYFDKWGASICHLLQASWDQQVSQRLTMQEVVQLVQSLLRSDQKLQSLLAYDEQQEQQLSHQHQLHPPIQQQYSYSSHAQHQQQQYYQQQQQQPSYPSPYYYYHPEEQQQQQQRLQQQQHIQQQQQHAISTHYYQQQQPYQQQQQRQAYHPQQHRQQQQQLQEQQMVWAPAVPAPAPATVQYAFCDTNDSNKKGTTKTSKYHQARKLPKTLDQNYNSSFSTCSTTSWQSKNSIHSWQSSQKSTTPSSSSSCHQETFSKNDFAAAAATTTDDCAASFHNNMMMTTATTRSSHSHSMSSLSAFLLEE